MDWFVPEAGADADLIERLTIMPDVRLERAEPGTIYGDWADTPFSIIRYRYRLTAEEVEGLPLADLRTVMARKLRAVVNRGARRDFIDVAACLERGHRLGALIDQAILDIPGLTRDSVLRALAYRAEAESEADPAGFPAQGWRSACDRINRSLRELVEGA